MALCSLSYSKEKDKTPFFAKKTTPKRKDILVVLPIPEAQSYILDNQHIMD
tara:strand:+ start:610 stop:762 length:153 start_codon:yes stop_codon:yes gene_type:complete